MSLHILLVPFSWFSILHTEKLVIFHFIMTDMSIFIVQTSTPMNNCKNDLCSCTKAQQLYHDRTIIAKALVTPRPWPTPGQLSFLPSMGRVEYQPKCGDALRLGSKGKYGSFHLWINVWVAGKTV